MPNLFERTFVFWTMFFSIAVRGLTMWLTLYLKVLGENSLQGIYILSLACPSLKKYITVLLWWRQGWERIFYCVKTVEGSTVIKITIAMADMKWKTRKSICGINKEYNTWDWLLIVAVDVSSFDIYFPCQCEGQT